MISLSSTTKIFFTGPDADSTLIKHHHRNPVRFFPNSDVNNDISKPAIPCKAHFMPFDFPPVRHAKLGM
jgi:hypothetical protein